MGLNHKSNVVKFLIIPVLFLMSVAVCGKDFNSNAEKENTTTIKTPVQWELVWEDNFDVDGLPDKKIWSFEEGYIRNKEAQYYTKERLENARVENGNLVIEARMDNLEWPQNYGCQYQYLRKEKHTLRSC